jgi:hypothetical protein
MESGQTVESPAQAIATQSYGGHRSGANVRAGRHGKARANVEGAQAGDDCIQPYFRGDFAWAILGLHGNGRKSRRQLRHRLAGHKERGNRAQDKSRCARWQAHRDACLARDLARERAIV